MERKIALILANISISDSDWLMSQLKGYDLTEIDKVVAQVKSMKLLCDEKMVSELIKDVSTAVVQKKLTQDSDVIETKNQHPFWSAILNCSGDELTQAIIPLKDCDVIKDEFRVPAKILSTIEKNTGQAR